MMKEREMTAVIWKEDDQFVSLCPQFDVSSFGKSQEEALENLKDAVKLYLQDEPRMATAVSSVSPVLKSFKIFL